LGTHFKNPIKPCTLKPHFLAKTYKNWISNCNFLFHFKFYQEFHYWIFICNCVLFFEYLSYAFVFFLQFDLSFSSIFQSHLLFCFNRHLYPLVRPFFNSSFLLTISHLLGFLKSSPLKIKNIIKKFDKCFLGQYR